MSGRKELEEALCRYITDTLSDIHSARGFCKKIPEWVSMREKERKIMMDIKNSAANIDLNIDHVTKSDDKGKAVVEYTKSKLSARNADSRRADLEKELDVVLEDTLRGLEELDCFLDAVEKLAVTSPHVFVENHVLHLTGIKFELMHKIIAAARMICPLLLSFKRDAKAFFLPKLQNVEVLLDQLDMYIETTQTICQELAKSFFSGFFLEMNVETQVDLNNVSENNIPRMLGHIEHLHETRMNQPFRTVFLFQVNCPEGQFSGFISEFEEQQPRMLQCLKDLEECAIQLDRMNKGSKISSVAGKSVRTVGGVLSIIGLALIPVTAGASLGLTMTGLGLGITSGVNSVVTTATGIGVNITQQKKANKAFKVLMEDVQAVQVHLGEVASQVVKMEASGMDVFQDACRILSSGRSIKKDIHSLILGAKRQVLDGVQRSTEEISDIGQAAAEESLSVVSESVAVGAIALNALTLGMDILSICKDSVSLAKGSKTKISQFIRARSALLSSEIDSWQKIHDSLCVGLQTSERKKAFLETPFYSITD